MKIKITELKKSEKNIKYLCFDVQPRYWEDSDINCEDDISWEEQKKGLAPKMPLSYRNTEERTSRMDEWYSWKVKINFVTSQVENWPEGVKANIHYKVCDQGRYWLETSDGESIHVIDSYVPDILDFYGNSYGDYLVMTIDDGKIVEWDLEKQLSKIDDFMKTEGF